MCGLRLAQHERRHLIASPVIRVVSSTYTGSNSKPSESSLLVHQVFLYHRAVEQDADNELERGPWQHCHYLSLTETATSSCMGLS